MFVKRQKIEDGKPCGHPGCLSRITHPCEGCGRIGGFSLPEIPDVWMQYFGLLEFGPLPDPPEPSVAIKGSRKCVCLLFHNWDKWETYLEESTHTYIAPFLPPDIRGKSFVSKEERQRRVCQRCGWTQDEEIRGS